MATLHDGSGRAVALGREIGRGGEGSVYEVASDPDLVAKVYHNPVEPEKVDKLKAMARLGDPDLLKVAAWPTGTLHEGPRGNLRGILLPKVTAHREVHQLYSPAHRKVHFPSADWSFLLHVAMNCASAFESVHSHGHVIGDVNQSGVLVSAQGMVRLIDCDSFQVRDGSRHFHCIVGVPQYTPPELVGKDFRTTVRTQHHDCFGLALLVFHLLFMGRHPYSGRYHGQGDMPIERAISEGRFAFSKSAASYQMAPPPHSLGLDALPGALGNLFEKAFARGATSRPLAHEWRAALKGLKDSLRKCHDDSAHVFPSGLSDCPWCGIEHKGGPAFFISQAAGFDFDNGFDFMAVWTRVRRITIPGPDALIAPPRPKTIKPAPIPSEARFDLLGDAKELPPEPTCQLEPLPEMPIYHPELRDDEPPFEREVIPPAPQFVPETVPSDPPLVEEHHPAAPDLSVPEYVAVVRAQFKNSLRDSEYLTAKWGTIIGLLAALGLIGFLPAAVVTLVITLPFGITWAIYHSPRKRLYQQNLRDAENQTKRSQLVSEERKRRHKEECENIDRRNAQRRVDREQEVARLEAARAALPALNKKKRQEWEAEVDRLNRLREEAASRNAEKLTAWKAHVAAVEANRFREWEQVRKRVEAQREAVQFHNARRQDIWKKALELHREQCRKITEHNAAVARSRSRYEEETTRRRDRLRELDERLRDLGAAWRAVQPQLQDEFRTTLASLNNTHSTYQQLRQAFEADRVRLSQNQMERQRDAFLSAILIEDENIKGIGKGRKATLSAYGIETAADVTAQALDSIPGFGPALCGELLAWRRMMENRFRFNPAQSLTPSDLRSLHMQYFTRRRQVQRELQTGEEKLQSITMRAQQRLREIQAKIDQIIPQYAQAEADLYAMSL